MAFVKRQHFFLAESRPLGEVPKDLETLLAEPLVAFVPMELAEVLLGRLASS